MKYFHLTFFLILFCSVFTAKAQRSMMDEVSEPYLAKLIQAAKDNNPRHKIFAKQVGIAQNNLNKIRLSWLDGLGIYYLYLPPTTMPGVINPTTNRSGFQLGFSFNIGSLLEKPAQINAAKGDKEIAKLEKSEYELSIEANVKERYYKYIQALTLLKQRTQLTLDGQTLLNSVRSKFEKGEESFENFNRALVFYNQQIQDKISTEADLLVTKASLEELLAKKLDDIKLDDTTTPGVLKPAVN